MIIYKNVCKRAPKERLKVEETEVEREKMFDGLAS